MSASRDLSAVFTLVPLAVVLIGVSTWWLRCTGQLTAPRLAAGVVAAVYRSGIRPVVLDGTDRLSPQPASTPGDRVLETFCSLTSPLLCARRSIAVVVGNMPAVTRPWICRPAAATHH